MTVYVECPTCGSRLEMVSYAEGTCSYVAVDAEAIDRKQAADDAQLHRLGVEIAFALERMRAGNARLIDSAPANTAGSVNTKAMSGT